MKKVNVLLFLTLSFSALCAQPDVQPATPDSGKVVKAKRKFQILVTNEKDAQKVEEMNEGLANFKKSMDAAKNEKSLGEALKTSFGSTAVQKTINATSNILSLGISYLTEALRSHQQDWYRTVQQQCTFTKTLKSGVGINDFYARPSSVGALDPADIKFEGFGCRHYLEVQANDKDEKSASQDQGRSNVQRGNALAQNQRMNVKTDKAEKPEGPAMGKEVFYLFCKLRRDSLGIAHIVNHSKFMVEVDSLMFNPKYCNLPNDSTGSVDSRFDFTKRKDLTFTVKARIYSSWINEAIILQKDQLLGEFTISAKIDPTSLRRSDSLFVYHKNDTTYKKLVEVTGDCFVVPRSFTGTADGKTYSPLWGTGQYRVEMSIEENCRINEEYYTIRESGNPQEVALADGTPGKRRWDKAKWKTEWKAMKARKKGSSFWKNAWENIVTAYKGSGWVETFTDPFTTALYTREAEVLNEWMGITDTSATAATGMKQGNASQSMQQGAATQGGAMPAQGGMPTRP